MRAKQLNWIPRTHPVRGEEFHASERYVYFQVLIDSTREADKYYTVSHLNGVALDGIEWYYDTPEKAKDACQGQFDSIWYMWTDTKHKEHTEK